MTDIHDFIPHAWLALALVGLALAASSLRQSIRDYRSTRPTNGFRVLALGDIAQEVLRVLLYLAFAGIGVYYFAAGLEVTRSGVAWIMVTAELIIIAKTTIQIMVNRYLRRNHMRVEGAPETQDQREDREFGEQRRQLETTHNEDSNDS